MSIRNYILNNIWWKLFSLLLATFTWLTIQASFQRHQVMMETPIDTVSRRTFPTVPISVLTSGSNTNRYRIDPSSIQVELTGAKEALTKLEIKDVHVFIDVGGNNDAKLFRGQLEYSVPEGVTVSSLSQNQVNIERITIGR